MTLTKSELDRLEAALTQAPGHIEFWRSRFEKMPLTMRDRLLELFETIPSAAGKFSDLQLRKETALAARDRVTWETILAEEENYVSSLLASDNTL
jgi:hypothetical protein